MKIRQGFVSNSSSSSFLIYGTPIDVDEDDFEGDLGELEFFSDPWDSNYIGKSWDSIKDDQTGKQFKDDIKQKVRELFPNTELEFDTFQEAWYDG